MFNHAPLTVLALAVLVAGCNTPPIPPGKAVDIPTALQNVLDGLCDFKQAQAGKPDHGVRIDSVTVELNLTVDGAQTPPVAVAPDIKFIPTVSYGHIITANTGSRLLVSLKNVDGPNGSGMKCGSSGPAK
ncbi:MULTISPECIES: hypothetical protein [Caballeronia]|uniref:hypothetical protein n=1 Tax=Caballeronia TaxID=1827195 RepID=UPI00045EF450|nr:MULTISPECIES: hypothetical protein [unclassified Caballeronia]MCE4545779.1 hypothetical protein [Caballeronia sp. PC1]MCE4572099.1 hypothetical protein [Caballeronia sp. CLC5]BAO91469.1 uncharacterized protein BRPE67_DCDS03140 [Burkholderia sp. RPE67]BBQ01130.1 hypothetical protein BSFA1_62580 [Burkholderia sp. SFA1]